jgi:hypothetical protein
MDIEPSDGQAQDRSDPAQPVGRERHEDQDCKQGDQD